MLGINGQFPYCKSGLRGKSCHALKPFLSAANDAHSVSALAACSLTLRLIVAQSSPATFMQHCLQATYMLPPKFFPLATMQQLDMQGQVHVYDLKSLQAMGVTMGQEFAEALRPTNPDNVQNAANYSCADRDKSDSRCPW